MNRSATGFWSAILPRAGSAAAGGGAFFTAALLLLLLCSRAESAGMIDPEDGMLDMSHFLRDNPYGFLPVPVVITEPSVGYGGGLFGLFLHGKGRRDNGHFIPPGHQRLWRRRNPKRHLVCRWRTSPNLAG